jgi:hypothetical protein
MKNWGLALMLLAILAAPVLACGFPLPAGTSMMAVSKAVCAADEPADTCQARQDAYQLMGKLQSVSVSDMQVDLYIDDGSTVTTLEAAGSYDFEVSESETGLGANVRANLTKGTVTSPDGTNTLNDTQFVVVEDKGYTSTDNGATWTYESLDQNTLLGLGLILGLSGPTGAGLDLYSDPAIFTVTIGDDVEIDGQTMHVQTLTFDLQALLSSADAITTMLNQSSDAMGLIGLDPSTLGDPAQLAMVSAFLLPALEGTEVSTTLYIGADDGYVHRVEENMALMLDSTKMPGQSSDSEPTIVTMTYQVSGDLSQFNQPMAIAAPENAQEGAGLLSEEGGLFGGSGLGGSLFGGQ